MRRRCKTLRYKKKNVRPAMYTSRNTGRAALSVAMKAVIEQETYSHEQYLANSLS